MVLLAFAYVEERANRNRNLPFELRTRVWAIWLVDRFDQGATKESDPQTVMTDIQAQLERFRRDGHYLQAHYDEFLERYPEQWVAIYNETVVATDDNLERIAERLAQMGYRGKAFVEFLTTRKRTLILSVQGSFSREEYQNR